MRVVIDTLIDKIEEKIFRFITLKVFYFKKY